MPWRLFLGAGGSAGQNSEDLPPRSLAPAGIAYISYNTYPGWHMRRARDMMHYHVHRFPGDTPDESVGRARALLDFLARSVPQENNPYALLLKQNLESLRQHTDSYLYHEHLEEHNNPVYFLNFCERLGRHGLRYLGEAEFNVMVAGTAFPAEVQRELNELAPNLIEKEQYMDFLRNRTFRQTLVCREEQGPNYDVRAELLGAFHVASPLKPAAAVDLAPDVAVEFNNSEGMTLTVNSPIVKAALAILGESWPAGMPFAGLYATARQRLPEPGNEEPIALARACSLLMPQLAVRWWSCR